MNLTYTYADLTECTATYRCAVCREDIPEHAHYEYHDSWQWRDVCSTCGRLIIELDGNSQHLRKKKLEAK